MSEEQQTPQEELGGWHALTRNAIRKLMGEKSRAVMLVALAILDRVDSRPREVKVHGCTFKLAPYQVVLTRRDVELVEDMELGEKAVRCALDKLEAAGLISRTKTRRGTVVTVLASFVAYGVEGAEEQEPMPTDAPDRPISGPCDSTRCGSQEGNPIVTIGAHSRAHCQEQVGAHCQEPSNRPVEPISEEGIENKGPLICPHKGPLKGPLTPFIIRETYKTYEEDVARTPCPQQGVLDGVVVTTKPKRKRKKSAYPQCPLEKIVALYGERLAGNGPWEPWSNVGRGATSSRIRARWRELFDDGRFSDEASGLECIALIFDAVAESDWMMNTTDKSGNTVSHDIGWLFTEKAMAGIVNGTWAENGRRR